MENVRRADQEVRDEQTVRPKLCMNDIPLLIAFIKAFSKLDQFKADVTFGAWLKRIVINKCIDCLKSKKQHLQELDEVHLKIVDSNYENEWLVDDTITVDEVKDAIQKLPNKYQYVIMLYLVEGYDHQEISQILNITEIPTDTLMTKILEPDNFQIDWEAIQ